MFRRFLSELKRRRVIRVAGVYAVTCWALFQVVSSLFPVLHLPPWTVTLTAVLLILGLPIALIVAWAFEPSPDGARLTPAPAADAPVLKLAWGDWALMAAAVAIIGLSVLQMTGSAGSLLGRMGSQAQSEPKSVAVLPFVNFSEQKDSDLFADGLTEEVINSLAQIPDLKVAGRTSAFYFKDKNEDLRLIGQKLGVSHVLEGSVRQEGEKLRVTVQLIKVSDGFHVWSETYDRKLDDTFAIQTEIANTVAGVLKTKLHMAAGGHAAPMGPEAYNAALVARAQTRRLGLEPLKAARATFKQLIDSGQADASVYAGYAQATIILAQNYLALDFNEADVESKAAITRALALDPRSVEAQVARGYRCVVRTIRMTDQACVAEAADAYETAVKLAPRDADALVGYANFLLKRQEPAKALELLKRATAVDPLNRVALMLTAGALSDIGRLDEAEREYRRAIELYPDFTDAEQQLGETLEDEGKLDQAEPWLKAAAAPGNDPAAALSLAHLYLNLGMDADLEATLARMKTPPVAEQIATVIRKVVAGDYAGALAFSEERFAQDPDPIWTSAIAEMSVMTGDFEKARSVGVTIAPDLFAPEPKVDLSLAREAATGAFIFDQLGDKAQARRVLAQLLAATAPRAGVPSPHNLAIIRVEAYALQGDKERALAELRGAIDRGYRTLWDIDGWVRLDRYPEMASLRDDPRFQAMLREIEADNAKMREKLLASRR